MHLPNSQGFNWVKWCMEVGIQLCGSIDVSKVDRTVIMSLIIFLAERAHHYEGDWVECRVRAMCVSEA